MSVIEALDQRIEDLKSEITALQAQCKAERGLTYAAEAREISLLHALEDIEGYCEHANDPTGELCECSTQMSIIAKNAIIKRTKALKK